MKDPVQHLYDVMTEQKLDEARAHYKPSTRYRASEAANCMRQIWYRLKGQRPKPRDAVGMMYGIIGDIDHDITRDLLNQSGVTVGHVNYAGEGAAGVETLQAQTPYTVDLNGKPVDIIVSGRADGSLNTPKGRALLEIKGIGGYAYDWMNKAYINGGHDGCLKYIREKRPSWYAQTQVSMALFGYDLCYLLVKDRSTGTLGFNNGPDDRSGIYIHFDQEFFRHTLKRFAFVQDKLNTKDEDGPKPEFAPKSKECGFCDFKWACHDAFDRRKKGLEPIYVYPGPEMMEYHDGAPSSPERENEER